MIFSLQIFTQIFQVSAKIGRNERTIACFYRFFFLVRVGDECGGMQTVSDKFKGKYIQIFAFSIVCELYRKRERFLFLFAGNDSHFAGSLRFYEVISSFDL